MRHHLSEFEGADQTRLFAQSWLPCGKPRARLAIVHGMTEHSSRYAHLAPPLTERGIATHAFDLRGHGRSAGKRGHLSRWQQLCADLSLFLRSLREQDPDTDLFLLGHSLGSLPALWEAIHHPAQLRGLVLSGTALEPVGFEFPSLLRLARMLSRLWPSFPIPLPPRASPILSRDPAVEAALRHDPLMLRHVTARFATEGIAMIGAVREQTPRLRLPVLLLHGGDDPINTLAGARLVLESAQSTDKQLKVYEGNLHEPFHDFDKERVIADLADWICGRTQAPEV
ncbi:MAG: hypothetical protein RLZZ399_2508 [Verrucomicrobiota bacterium]|jgi:alpha-beta hydrolase superfamily lysophospholipase